jgi:hypothetical protein
MPGYPKYNIRGTYLFIFFLLIAGHLFINTYVPNILINVLAILALSFFTYYYFLHKYKYFEYLLVIYFVSHFSYAVNQGGGFIIMSFLVLSIYYLIKKHHPFELKYNDRFMGFLIIVFLIHNILGWIFINDTGFQNILLGALSLLGYIMIFRYTSKLRLDELRIRYFIYITIVLTLYSSIVIINSYFEIFQILSPMLPSTARFGSNVQAGMMGWSELSGEHGLMTAILFSTLLATKSSKVYSIKNIYLYIGLFGSLFNLLMSRSRSVIILLIIYYLILGFYLFFIAGRKGTSKIKLLIGVLVILIIFKVISSLIGTQYLVNRLTSVNTNNITVESVLSGEAINRDYAFSFFYKRLKDKSWWLGYGWGSNYSNRVAWFVNPDVLRSGYHSLYFSLPMLFGWLGSLAFLGIFLITLKRLYVMLRENNKIFFLNSFALSLFFMILFFLINEYKIEALRLPHYFMVIWIWLGMGNATYFTYKKELYENSLASSVPVK